MRAFCITILSVAVLATNSERCAGCGVGGGGLVSSSTLGIGSSTASSTLGSAVGGAGRSSRSRTISVGSTSTSLGVNTQCCRDNENDIRELQS